MAAKKYTKIGETPKAFECANKKCKWKGDDEDKAKKPNPDGWGDTLVCPKCSNEEFYGLLSD